MSLLQKYKPSVSGHTLLIIAGLAWTTAGVILLGRGLAYLIVNSDMVVLRVAGGILSGLIFYLLFFAEISGKHIQRIRGLNIPYPCAFSFFNFRSYLMMAIMISGGIFLRKLDIINRVWLYTFFITMGVPLLISAARFFYAWITNKSSG